MLRLPTLLMKVSIELQTMQLTAPVQCIDTYLCHHYVPDKKVGQTPSRTSDPGTGAPPLTNAL